MPTEACCQLALLEETSQQDERAISNRCVSPVGGRGRPFLRQVYRDTAFVQSQETTGTVFVLAPECATCKVPKGVQVLQIVEPRRVLLEICLFFPLLV